MAKPCRIDDTVCVQPCREVVVSSFCPRGCSSVLPKGCPSDRSSFGGPPEGLSATPSGDCSTASRRAVRVADGGVHPRGWEVVNPSCGDLHRRSSSTLLPAALRVGNEYD